MSDTDLVAILAAGAAGFGLGIGLIVGVAVGRWIRRSLDD